MCVQVAVPPPIVECYCSTLDHNLLSNALCLTASSYKMIPLHLSQEDTTA
jgi:hypothetical protein